VSRQTPTAIVRRVEAAIRHAHETTTQEVIADQLGLLSHSGVNARIAKVNSGKIDSLLESYDGKQVVSLLAANRPFADALIAALASEDTGNSATAVQALRTLGKAFSAELGEILDDLDDNDLSPAEADAHLCALDRIAADLAVTRADLLQRKSTRRNP
jgi:hypothetical protein